MSRRAAFLIFALSVTSPLAAGGDPLEPRHVIYLHGRIVQAQQNVRPEHPEYGHYEFDAIKKAFRDRGFEVTAEMRPRDATVDDFANRVVKQVRALIASGVRAERITVVGASMGSAIALRTAARLQNRQVRFAVLGPCLSTDIAAVAAGEGASPSGHILAVRDESDVPDSECSPWTASPTEDLIAREIVIDTGRSHGFLYQPLPEWLEPVVAWARAK